MRRWDVTVAAVVAAGCVLLGVGGLPEWYWSAGAALLLALRRSRPVVFLVLAATVSGAHTVVSGGFSFPGDLVDLVAVYAVAAYGPVRLRHAGLLVGAAAATLVAGRALQERLPVSGILPVALIVAATLAAWSTGLMQRQQRAAVAAAEHGRLLAERDSAMRARLAVHEERTRISREMHDIIAHSLASIIAQAEGGRVAARQDAAVAGPLFDRISEQGRFALTDVKRLLSVVDDGDPGEFANGLGELPALLDGAAAAGLDVTVEVDGEERPLGAGMDLAVYRVIQESLTNVLKHGPAPRARLRLRWTPAALDVSVVSPLASAQVRDLEEGRGLSGIRQRCSLFNGVCEITAGAELAVITRWPLTGSEAAAA